VQTSYITTDFVFAWYKRVEYIWTTWIQYINTWVSTNWNDNTEMEADIKYYQTPSENTANWKNEYKWFFMWITNWNEFYWWAWWYWWFTNVSNDFNKHTFKIKTSENKLYVDWTWYTFNDNPWSWTIYSWNISIWATYRPTTNQYEYKSLEYIYSYKIFKSWTLVRDFRPVYRKSDNVIWLLDIVNKQFYTNSWSWSFTKWPDVN